MRMSKLFCCSLRTKLAWQVAVPVPASIYGLIEVSTLEPVLQLSNGMRSPQRRNIGLDDETLCIMSQPCKF